MPRVSHSSQSWSARVLNWPANQLNWVFGNKILRRGIVWGVVLAIMSGARLTLSANPTGASTTAGSITISTQGQTLTIQQQSQRAIINWQDFSIAAGELTKFIQPDAASAVLNRVVSGSPSTLLGNLAANGRIFLLNPNGILVGAGARIDAAGFLASTLDVRDDDFLRGGDLLFRGGSTAAVQNLGAINALGGDVFLIARRIENKGSLAAANGTTGMAAGSEVLLTTGGSERVFVQAASAPGTLINAGQISATTAELKAAGGNAYALAINNSGVVRATGTAVRNGQVWLVATGGTVETSGTLDASSASGQGGAIKVSGERVLLAAGSRLDASGATGGGEISVLGGAQVTLGGTLAANASGSGNGGYIETSAARVQVTDGVRVTTTATQGRSGTWLIDPVDFTIAASGGDMTGAAVGTALTGGNFTIQSTTGATGTAGVVNVNDPVSWNANKLTLNAQTNINLNASLNGSGTASLALQYGQGAVAAGNTSNYVVNAAVTLPAGNNFSTKLGSDGAVKNYAVITSLGAAGSTTGTDLQGVNGNLAGNYALGGDIDASATSGWNGGLGFAPIGAIFTGTFDGLGHAITGLFINRPGTASVGLFARIGNSPIGSVSNLRLESVNVTGANYTGALVGSGNGSVANCSSTGAVNGAQYTGGLVGYATAAVGSIKNSHSDATVVGTGYVGGLVGADFLGSISGSYATGTVTSTATNYTGGLVGQMVNATITNSSSTSQVSGKNYVGGLVGSLSGTSSITNSSSTGPVNGTNEVGGLVGNSQNTASITTSHSTGAVGGVSDVGGLIGYNTSPGAISNSYSSCPIAATGSFMGGLIGYNGVASGGSVANCYSTGTVSGGAFGGGFIGYNSMTGGTITNCYSTSIVNQPSGAGFIMVNAAGTVTNCYSTGTVTGNDTGGGGSGFIAQNSGTVTNCYSTSATVGDGSSGFITLNNASGTVTNCYSTGLVGVGIDSSGFVRQNNGSTTAITNCFWDTQTSGFATSAGGTGMTTAQMKNLINFTSATAANGNVNPNWDLTSVWRMYDGYTYPLLKTFLTPLTVTANGATQTYNGTSYSGGNGVTYSTTPSAALLGPLSYGGTAQGVRNVGSYTIVPAGLYSGQQGYDITTVNGTLTINPATLTLTAASATKAYDGTTASIAVPTAAGLGSGDTLTGLAQIFDSPNAGSRTLSVSAYALNDGNSGNNYTVSLQTATGTINPAILTYTANTASRTYGAANPTLSGTVTGLVNGETLAGVTTGTAAFSSLATTSSNAGSYAINGSGLTASNGNYTLVQAAGNATALTINPATLTYTATPASRTYGATNPAFGGTVTGFVNGDTPAGATTGTLAFATPAPLTSGVGSYAINGSGLTANNGNYTLVQAAGNATALTINPAALTIVADSKSRAFGVANPTLTATYTGLVNGDSSAVVSGLTMNTTATTASPVGSYPITAAGATAGNYTITFTPGTLAVGQNLLTITADNKAKTYGAVLPGFTASYSGLVNGDTSSVVTGLQFSTTATAGSNVGAYAITPFGASATNYALAYVPGTLTINPAALTITANNATKTYGAALPGFTASYSGFVNGDSSGVVSGLQLNTVAGAGSNVGSYAITPSGATATNYTIGYVSGTLTINSAALTIAADSKSRVFGAANPVLTATYTGLVNGDTAAVVSGLTLNTTATTTSAAGSYPITAASATATNYTITFTPGTLTVGRNLLTISADDKTKTYGAAVPDFTASFSGLVNGDTSSVVAGLQFSTNATLGSNVGTYTITPFGASASNYDLAYVAGTLTINPAALTITANSATKTYGAALPGFTASYTGLVNGDTSGVVTGLRLSTAAIAGSNVGSYAITPSNASAANYTIGYVPGMLTIDPAALTIAADNQRKAFGAANPALTATYTGLVNGDTSAVVSGLTLNTTATTASAVGSYPITVAGATAGNYTISIIPGTLTVGQNLLTIAADNKTKTYGAALPNFTASFSGLVNGDTSSVVTGLQFSSTATVGSNVGTYAITPFGATAANYSLAYVPGTLTINPAALTITANSATKIYGAALPGLSASYAGLVNGDASSVVTGLQLNTAATAGSNVGSYAITPSGASAANYALTFVPGTLTINSAALTIAADSQSKAFGAANPPLTASYTGLVNGDTPAVISGLTLNTPATTASPAGNYAITLSGASAANYTIACVPGTLSVTRPTVMVNDLPAVVLTVDLVPVQTDEFVVADFGDRCVLVPATHARLGASLDNTLTDSLRHTGNRALLPEVDGGTTAQSESRRSTSLGWREELTDRNRLVVRAIVHSSSFDAFSRHENPIRGLLFTAMP